MNKLDDLIANLKLLLPRAKLYTDGNHDEARGNHWLVVRVKHAVLMLIWHPGKSFQISSDADESFGEVETVMLNDDPHEVIAWIVGHIIDRGLA